MALRLNGSSSGYVELDVPAAAGSHTLTLPDGGGSSGQYLQTNGSGGLSWQTVADTQITESAVFATTSGSEVIIDSIPSDAKRIMITFQGLSCTDSNNHIIRIGDSGGIETSGYVDRVRTATSSLASFTNGWHIGVFGNATALRYGHAFLTTTGSNLWVCTGITGLEYSGGSQVADWGGHKTLSGTLDRVSISLLSGTFDAGSFRVSWET
jgi:hypothetical protein